MAKGYGGMKILLKTMVIDIYIPYDYTKSH